MAKATKKKKPIRLMLNDLVQVELLNLVLRCRQLNCFEMGNGEKKRLFKNVFKIIWKHFNREMSDQEADTALDLAFRKFDANLAAEYEALLTLEKEFAAEDAAKKEGN